MPLFEIKKPKVVNPELINDPEILDLDSNTELNPDYDSSTIEGLGAFSGILGDNADAGIKELLSEENLLVKTDLSPAAIPLVARILTLAYKYKAPNLQNFMWTYLKLRISKDRKGRDEIVAITLRNRGVSELDQEGF